MADSPASSSSKFGFLTRKIGPVPIWLIALGLVAAFYWYENFGPGASSGSSAAAAADPALDPDTGNLYAVELAAAEQQISDLQAGTGTGDGTGDGPGGGSGTGTGDGPGGGAGTGTGNGPVPIPGPPAGTGSTGTTYVRETAPGGQTLAAWATDHGTTGKGVSNATAEAHKLGLINAANWAKWQAYVAKGYKNNMPKGLVFYVSKKAANTKVVTSTTNAVSAAANTADPQGVGRWRTAA